MENDPQASQAYTDLVTASADLLQKAQELAGITVKRTGNVHSIAATEYEVSFDGRSLKFWTPPWHDMEDPEEDIRAFLQALKLIAIERNKRHA